MKEARRKAVHQYLVRLAQAPTEKNADSVQFRALESGLRYWETYGRLPPTARGARWHKVEQELNILADGFEMIRR